MPCYKCDHDLKEHADEHGLVGEGEPCTKCDCSSYGPSDFECGQCGDGFGEWEARQGHEYCKACATEHNMCIMCGNEKADAGHDLCRECADRDHGGSVMLPELNW